MAELKTQPTDEKVATFLAGVEDEQKRSDSETLIQLMSEATGAPPVMWGKSIIGFGSYRYRYATGREGDWMELGFSPRKKALSLYIMSGANRYEEFLGKLGKYTTGKSCLYVKRLSDIDLEVLRAMLQQSVTDLRNKSIDYGGC